MQQVNDFIAPLTSKTIHHGLLIVLPKGFSEKLPRQGRTTIESTINNYHFQTMLEPDDHWLSKRRIMYVLMSNNESVVYASFSRLNLNRGQFQLGR